MVRIVLNTFLFSLIFNLLSREAVFLAVFMKNSGDPLGVKVVPDRTSLVHTAVQSIQPESWLADFEDYGRH